MSSIGNGHGPGGGAGDHGTDAHGAHGNELGAIGSQEAVTVVALAVTMGILCLMLLIGFMSRIL